MKITPTQAHGPIVGIDEITYQPGQVMEFPDHKARMLIARGKAKEVLPEVDKAIPAFADRSVVDDDVTPMGDEDDADSIDT